MGLGKGAEARMTAQDLTPEMYASASDLHARSGIDYKLPDLNSHTLLVKKAATDNGDLKGFCVLRITAECMLTLDPDLRPEEKMEVMSTLSPVVIGEAWRLGLDDVMATIHEDVEKRFTKRLGELGWSRDRNGWALWSRPTEAHIAQRG